MVHLTHSVAVALSGQALDAEEASAMFDDDVVGRAVAPGLGDAESELGGAGHETQFGPLAARFGVADEHSGKFQWGFLGEWRQQKTRPTEAASLFYSLI